MSGRVGDEHAEQPVERGNGVEVSAHELERLEGDGDLRARDAGHGAEHLPLEVTCLLEVGAHQRVALLHLAQEADELTLLDRQDGQLLFAEHGHDAHSERALQLELELVDDLELELARDEEHAHEVVALPGRYRAVDAPHRPQLARLGQVPLGRAELDDEGRRAVERGREVGVARARDEREVLVLARGRVERGAAHAERGLDERERVLRDGVDRLRLRERAAEGRETREACRRGLEVRDGRHGPTSRTFGA